jgi:hypothetical protein
LSPEPAASIPITRPPSSSGPPESPGTSDALVEIKSVRRAVPPWSSRTVIDRCKPVRRPFTVVRLPDPPALPTAVTATPTRRLAELPSVAVASPCAPASWSSATSFETL